MPWHVLEVWGTVKLTLMLRESLGGALGGGGRPRARVCMCAHACCGHWALSFLAFCVVL